MTFYAFAPHAAHLEADLCLAWSQWARQGALFYALADDAMRPGLVSWCARYGLSAPVAIYEASPLQAARAVSPLLLALPPWPEIAAGAVRDLLAGFDGAPALSFIATRMEPQQLMAHLTHLLVLRCDGDGSRWMLRLADARVVPALLRVLGAGRRQRAMAGIAAWLTIGRDGTLQSTDGAPDRPVADPGASDTDFVLSERQFLDFTRASEPDEVLAQLVSDGARFDPRHTGLALHGIASSVLARLDTIGVVGARDRAALVLRAATSPHDWERDPDLADMLEQAERRLSSTASSSATGDDGTAPGPERTR